MNIAFTELTPLKAGEMIKKRELSVEELTKAYLTRCAVLDGEVNAFLRLEEAYALQSAAAVQKRIDAKEELGPLAGVPFGLKDNICTKGLETTCASRILGGFVPPYEATLMKKMSRGGGVLIGKTNMDEFAMGSTTETSYYKTTKNPWNSEHVPGGSSGGSAAAVAAREVPYAIGSDTGGSIRQPAAYCGVTGLKPTYGAVSRFGLIAYGSSLDQIGPIAPSAMDCAAILDMISGYDEKDATSMKTQFHAVAHIEGGVQDLVIGIPKSYFGEGLNGEVRETVAAAIKVLTDAGAKVEEFDFSILDYAVPAYYIIASAEASSNLSRFDGVKYGFRAEDAEGLRDVYLKTRTQGFGGEVKKRIMLGAFALSSGYYDAYYNKALQVKALIKKAFDDAFAKYDMILGPVAPTTAPKIGESLKDPLAMYLSDIYTVSVNLAGLPGIALPCGFDQKGLPIGMQLIAQAFDDEKLLRAAHCYQQLTDFHRQCPALAGKGGL
ncbi:MAG TPA: Asp-tRNA(Asn)/Glu-tRNA(Gln) amidotransferase subunit GatA [Clostridiales bacterium]|nr:Asp-tRNA(Asn)/Glu-tRNA(Gln) amidotransferase subunit GatA [Clostridiales bacterium]